MLSRRVSSTLHTGTASSSLSMSLLYIPGPTSRSVHHLPFPLDFVPDIYFFSIIFSILATDHRYSLANASSSLPLLISSASLTISSSSVSLSIPTLSFPAPPPCLHLHSLFLLLIFFFFSLRSFSISSFFSPRSKCSAFSLPILRRLCFSSSLSFFSFFKALSIPIFSSFLSSPTLFLFFTFTILFFFFLHPGSSGAPACKSGYRPTVKALTWSASCP